MKTFWLTLSFGTVLVASTGFAGDAGGAVSRSRQSQAEMEDIGAIGEPDGKETVAAAPSPFRFSASARGDYTTNARLSGNHASSDFIFFPTLEAGYHQNLTHGFAFDAVARIEAGAYASHDERAFIGYSVTNTLEWRPKPNLPRVYVGVEPYRFDGFDGQGRITQAVGTSVGTDWGYGFNHGKSLAFVAYSFTDYFSNPQKDSRLTHTATVGLTHVLRPDMTLQVFYQYVHELFPSFNDREDSRHIVGLNLTYQMSKNLFSTLSTTFVDSDSTQARASYQSAGVSLGVTYHY